MSRREFAKKVAVAGAVAISPGAIAQAAKKKPTEAENLAANDLKSLETKLEQPLPAKLKDLAKTALANSRKNSMDRLKFPLPEGSEPCTTFIPQSARSTDR